VLTFGDCSGKQRGVANDSASNRLNIDQRVYIIVGY
jgi:hypothetical protein